jgi:hypothetical protein
MVYFPTKNPTLGKNCRIFQWNELIYFVAIGSMLQIFGIFSGNLMHFMVNWYIFKFWYTVSRKIWQPWLQHRREEGDKSIPSGVLRTTFQFGFFEVAAAIPVD